MDNLGLFTKSCEIGDIEKVKTLLSTLYINGIYNGLTGLLEISINNHENIVKSLLDNGADVDIVSCNYKTSLMLASWNGHINIVKLLVERGADINKKDSDNNTPITLTLQRHDSEVVEYLILKGAQFDCMSTREYEKILNNILFKCTDMNILLSHMYMKNIDKDTLFMLACNYLAHDLIISFVNKINVNMRDINGNTPLILACMSDSCIMYNYIVSEKLEKLDKVAFLLKHGADVNSYNNHKITPLMMACKAGNIKNVKTLIRSGANIHHKSTNGSTAYTYSILYRVKSISKLLLSAGYDNLEGLSNREVNFMTEYRNSREYYDVRDDLLQPDGSDIFSIIVLLSDDYYKF